MSSYLFVIVVCSITVIICSSTVWDRITNSRKKNLENLHFWQGAQSGKIFVGVREKHGAIIDRVDVTDKLADITIPAQNKED